MAHHRAGSPLPAPTQASYSRAAGMDLSEVRTHSDQSSATSAALLGKRAFTVGTDISFASGREQGSAGQRLLAHEVAHVVQQRGGSPGAGASHSPEAEADVAADALGRGESVAIGSVAGSTLQGFSDDIRIMSVSAALAQGLDDADLVRQLAILDEHLPTLPVGSAEAGGVRENKAVLQNEQVRRLMEGREPQTSSSDTTSVRLARFKQAVLLSARHRLSQNRDNLVLWREVIENRMSAVSVQTHVLAQSASDLHATAQQTGGMRAFDDWSGDPNPFRRNVREHQVRGEWRACTGCHEMVRADSLSFDSPRVGPAWTSPADRLTDLAGLPPRPAGGAGASNANALAVLAAIEAIRPVVAPLGDRGYRIIPDDVFSLRSGQTALQLRATLVENIEKRRRDYAELGARIAAGDITYLQLTPIFNALLPQADPDVQQAVRDEIRQEQILAVLTIGGVLILTLLSFVFPPLALALAAIQLVQGYGEYQTGKSYLMGHGAGVFSREQEDSAGALMASGTVNMAMAVATIAMAAVPRPAAPGQVSSPSPGRPVDVLPGTRSMVDPATGRVVMWHPDLPNEFGVLSAEGLTRISTAGGTPRVVDFWPAQSGGAARSATGVTSTGTGLTTTPLRSVPGGAVVPGGTPQIGLITPLGPQVAAGLAGRQPVPLAGGTGVWVPGPLITPAPKSLLLIPETVSGPLPAGDWVLEGLWGQSGLSTLPPTSLPYAGSRAWGYSAGSWGLYRPAAADPRALTWRFYSGTAGERAMVLDVAGEARSVHSEPLATAGTGRGYPMTTPAMTDPQTGGVLARSHLDPHARSRPDLAGVQSTRDPLNYVGHDRRYNEWVRRTLEGRLDRSSAVWQAYELWQLPRTTTGGFPIVTEEIIVQFGLQGTPQRAWRFPTQEGFYDAMSDIEQILGPRSQGGFEIPVAELPPTLRGPGGPSGTP